MKSIILLFILIASSSLLAIEKLDGQWTLDASFGIPILTDSEFYGTWEEYDNTSNGEDKIYPIGDESIIISNVAFDLNYRFAGSNWGVFSSYNMFLVGTSRMSSISLSDPNEILVSGFQGVIGASYDWGGPDDNWIYSLKGGLLSSIYSIAETDAFFSFSGDNFMYNIGIGLDFTPSAVYNFEKLPLSIGARLKMNMPFFFISDDDRELFEGKNFLVIIPQFTVKLWM